MKTRLFTEDNEAAAALIRQGGLVAVPTETVYGLAGNGLDADAVAKIYEVKGRPAVKPLSLMIPDAQALERYCLDVPEQARTLAEKFWPGPLTIVLRARPDIPEIVLAGGETVGLRCPDHPLTLALLRACALPLAAPSANPSGAESPKTAGEVLRYFDGKIDAVIDGGPCGLGTESTIIDLSRRPYRLLRQGALAEDEIADALAEKLTVIGITGGSGCGKTTALRELEKLGALVLDCDAVYHELLTQSAEMLREIETAFPGVCRDGALDRKALGAIVFRDPEALERLNTITHRHVGLAVRDRLRRHAMAGGTLAAVDAIELISSGLAARCTTTIAVLAEPERRIARIMARDGISREYAKLRVEAQRPDAYFREHCEHVLLNNAGSDAFQEKCRQLLKEILNHG